MKFSHKLLSGLALALAFSNAANASIVEYNYSLTSGSNSLTANFFVDDSVSPNYGSIVGGTSSFTFNGTQYVADDGGTLLTDSQLGAGVQGYSIGMNSGLLAFGINNYTDPIGTTNNALLLNMIGIILFNGPDTGTLTKVIATSPSAVPVPAAAWLFGSALLGFAGLRRKQQA